MNKTFVFTRIHYTVSITYHELHCAVYISQYVCILYTNVTLASHYNEFHVAKQPHITFLSCDFCIDTSRNSVKMRGTANTSILSVVNRWREISGQTGLSSMDPFMGQVLIRYAMSSILEKHC